jgi:hypothetical protein
MHILMQNQNQLLLPSEEGSKITIHITLISNRKQFLDLITEDPDE